MKFTTTLALLPFLLSSVTAGPTLLKQRQEEPDCTGNNGPANEAKTAVKDFAVSQVFGSGTFCPKGCEFAGGMSRHSKSTSGMLLQTGLI